MLRKNLGEENVNKLLLNSSPLSNDVLSLRYENHLLILNYNLKKSKDFSVIAYFLFELHYTLVVVVVVTGIILHISSQELLKFSSSSIYIIPSNAEQSPRYKPVVHITL
jgi:hypothetical protein